MVSVFYCCWRCRRLRRPLAPRSRLPFAPDRMFDAEAAGWSRPALLSWRASTSHRLEDRRRQERG